ncbi:MAG TPA: hypothetical protein VFF49_02755 [Thermodesulfobacteriota bacterium]|nr:hypothetical protein [Thermodesulfobacteriota bacterium]
MEKIKSVFSIKWVRYISLLFLLLTLGFLIPIACDGGNDTCSIEAVVVSPADCAVQQAEFNCHDSDFDPETFTCILTGCADCPPQN